MRLWWLPWCWADGLAWGCGGLSGSGQMALHETVVASMALGKWPFRDLHDTLVASMKACSSMVCMCVCVSELSSPILPCRSRDQTCIIRVLGSKSPCLLSHVAWPVCLWQSLTRVTTRWSCVKTCCSWSPRSLCCPGVDSDTSNFISVIAIFTETKQRERERGHPC